MTRTGFVGVAAALALSLGSPAAGQAECRPGSGSDLSGQDLTAPGTELPDDLRCADLSGSTLDGLNLTQEDFSRTIARGASFRDATLIQAEFVAADLRDVVFEGADLGQAHLIDADLREADFAGADLIQADLSGANLTGADLHGATLDQATLVGADLTNADLRDASLDQADLSEASLRGADVSGGSRIQLTIDGADLTGVRGRLPVVPAVAAVAGLVTLVSLIRGLRAAGRPSSRGAWLLGMARSMLQGQLGATPFPGQPVPTQQPGGLAGWPSPGSPAPTSPPGSGSAWSTPAQGWPNPSTTPAGVSWPASPPAGPFGDQASEGRSARRYLFAVLGAVLLGLGVHLFLGGMAGTIGEQLDPISVHCVGAALCPIGVGSGVLGLTIGIPVAIAGGAVRHFAR